jgi:tRNA(His) 5'-end guanylyltransferase
MGSKFDDLGKRMKTYYEEPARTRLTRRVPVVVRIDGKAFHTFTRGFRKPFDGILMNCMAQTLKYLCENVQGCIFGYQQSDEVTLILQDYATLTTDAFFGYEVQKICSVTASMATMKFNKEFNSLLADYFLGQASMAIPRSNPLTDPEEATYREALRTANKKGAMFDSRCFNIPKEEVTNLVYWRQLDASRNSIQAVGQANFSHRELQGKSCNNIQDMLMAKGINWNDFSIACKRGIACYKADDGWFIDYEMPILRGEDREYVERLL